MKKLLLLCLLQSFASQQILQAQSDSLTLGTGTGTNSATGYPAPYGPYFGSSKHQILILGEELRAAGLKSVSITKIAFNVFTPPGAPLLDFTIKMKATTQSSVTANFDNEGMITVLGPVNLLVLNGWNSHTLNLPIYWDGETNILIETCFNNNAPTSVNAQMYYSTTPFASVVYKSADLGSQCAATSGGSTSSNRPNIKLHYTPPGQLGGGTLLNCNTCYPAPYGNWYWGSRHQFLVRADELKGIGFAAGNIYSLSFNVKTIGGAILKDFKISIKQTTEDIVPSFFDDENALLVWGPKDYRDEKGWNEHYFKKPFYWDGISNILILTCFNNTSYTNNAIMYYTDAPYQATLYEYQDASGVCDLSGGIVLLSRTNMRLSGHIESKGIDVGVFSSLPDDNGCGDEKQQVIANIRNYGDTALSDIPVTVEISGNQTHVFSDTVKGPLASGDILAVTIGTINTLAGGSFTIKSYTSVPGDVKAANDTLIKPVTLLPGPAPNASFTYTASGLSVKFKASQKNAPSYAWNFGDGENSDEQNPEHAYSDVGEYEVTLEVGNDCGTDSKTKTIELFNSGIDSDSPFHAAMNIYPVLNNGKFSVSLVFAEAGTMKLSLINPIGQDVYTEEMQVIPGKWKKDIQFVDLPSGLYYVKAALAGKELMGKVVVE